MYQIRLSKLFTKTSKNVPADETAQNAKLLIQAGYVHKEMAGVYNFLPLGLQVLENIKGIVRNEMNALGASELVMSSLQRKELWEKTDRWDDNKVDVWFKSQLKNNTEVGFGWSHEEPISDMMKNYIASYRDLPVYTYQFQTKLRNELRAKSGIMRGREFVMKDMYSYSVSEEAHQKFYDETTAAYLRIFEKVGLGSHTFLTFASGEPFTQFSHEFQTITDSGEDTVYLHRGKKLAINEEVLTDEVLDKLGLARGELEQVKAAEVGNIFSFGAAKSEQLGLYFSDQNGLQKPVILGSYGIGISRLMGVASEHFADENGLVWPEEIAPAKVHLVRLGEEEAVVRAADKVFEAFKSRKISVIYDDRDVRAGEKFADADLMGMPYRVVISKKTIENNTIELKKRINKDSEKVRIDILLDQLEAKT